MAARPRAHDRRAADRPANGDTAACPVCPNGRLEFSERYRVPLVSTGKYVVLPAWVCDTCGDGRPVRTGPDETRTILQQARTARANARRSVMKTRAALGRAHETI